ncbi:TlpA family protein disulfide reductase [Permianibacter sp. IMCC34836]|nr:TlpA family protein disulfide reductase [Permianibacter fluminis]
MKNKLLSLLLLASAGLGLSESAAALDLSAYQGKVVYLDFWASWCKPCRQSFPWLAEMQQRYGKDGFVVVAVNVDKEKALADRFLTEMPHPFTVEFDPDGTLATRFGVEAMPSSVLIDKQGHTITTHAGFFEKNVDKYEQRIRAALSL